MISRHLSQQSIKKCGRFTVLVVFLISLTLSSMGSGDAEAASSPYRLIGTVLSKSFTGAVLNDATGVQSFYRLYDKLPDGSQVVQVRDDSILLKGPDGTLYDMYIAHDTKTAASTGPPVSIEPYAPGTAISDAGAEQKKQRQRHRGRRSSGSEEE